MDRERNIQIINEALVQVSDEELELITIIVCEYARKTAKHTKEEARK